MVGCPINFSNSAGRFRLPRFRQIWLKVGKFLENLGKLQKNPANTRKNLAKPRQNLGKIQPNLGKTSAKSSKNLVKIQQNLVKTQTLLACVRACMRMRSRLYLDSQKGPSSVNFGPNLTFKESIWGVLRVASPFLASKNSLLAPFPTFSLLMATHSSGKVQITWFRQIWLKVGKFLENLGKLQKNLANTRQNLAKPWQNLAKPWQNLAKPRQNFSKIQ